MVYYIAELDIVWIVTIIYKVVKIDLTKFEV